MTSYKENLFYGAPTLGFAKARQLRRSMTEAETILWKFLRNKKLAGHKFRRQHPLGLYIADFYCHESKLVIESDGKHHNNPDEKKYDARRTFTFGLDKIKVLRFSNSDIMENLSWVLAEIEKELKK
ncbi:MAG: endonuclease domain-containing protein [Bacteroidia bacterium]|nr:endonuclease domain-containing protein [Bacteroidia bacterium]